MAAGSIATAFAVASLAQTAGSTAQWIQEKHSGNPDDVYLSINNGGGHITFWPDWDYSYSMKSQERIYLKEDLNNSGSFSGYTIPLNVPLESSKNFTVTIWDRDTGSANDILGYHHFKVGRYEVPHREKYIFFSDDEGSVYELDLEVTAVN